MKTPKIPNPKPAVQPTAPVVNASGIANATQKMRQNYGFMSTFLGANSGGNSQRLSQYLGGKVSSQSSSIPGRSKVAPGGVVRH